MLYCQRLYPSLMFSGGAARRRPSEDELAGGEIANAHGMYVILEPKNKKVFHDPNNRTSLHRDR